MQFNSLAGNLGSLGNLGFLGNLNMNNINSLSSMNGMSGLGSNLGSNMMTSTSDSYLGNLFGNQGSMNPLISQNSRAEVHNKDAFTTGSIMSGSSSMLGGSGLGSNSMAGLGSYGVNGNLGSGGLGHNYELIKSMIIEEMKK